MIDARSWSVNGACVHNPSMSNQSNSKNRRSSADNSSVTSCDLHVSAAKAFIGVTLSNDQRVCTIAPHVYERRRGQPMPEPSAPRVSLRNHAPVDTAAQPHRIDS